MTQVTISVVLGPRQSRPSSREKPSVPWEAPSRAISGAFSPARMASSNPKPTASLMSCAHHTACVSNRMCFRSAMLDISIPTVAPSSFQPFSSALT